MEADYLGSEVAFPYSFFIPGKVFFPGKSTITLARGVPPL
jgi:hypothetical protein